MVELDSANVPALRKEFPRSEILEKDFMAFSGRKFDAIVMNPPFSKSQDAKHILHAYSLLSPGGKLVSAASSAVKNREGAAYAKLRSLSPKFLELPAGSFREFGTMVNTVVVVLEKP